MNRIKEKREALGLTQKELAHRASMSKSHLVNLEKDKYNCSLYIGMSLAKALGTTLDGLFWEEGGKECQK